MIVSKDEKCVLVYTKNCTLRAILIDDCWPVTNYSKLVQIAPKFQIPEDDNSNQKQLQSIIFAQDKTIYQAEMDNLPIKQEIVHLKYQIKQILYD